MIVLPVERLQEAIFSELKQGETQHVSKGRILRCGKTVGDHVDVSRMNLVGWK